MRKSNCIWSPCRGFTLVELLVVIGVIAMLISILLPALNRARRAAQNISCLSGLHQQGIALQMYASQNNGWLPPGWGPDGNPDDTFDDYLATLMPGSGRNSQTPVNADPLHSMLICVEGYNRMEITNPVALNYACNIAVLGSVSDAANPCHKITQIKRSSEVIVIGDANQAFPDGGSWVAFDFRYQDTHPAVPDPGRPITQLNGGTSGNYDGRYGSTGLRYRHMETKPERNGHANVLMLDGHAEGIALGELKERNIAVTY